MINLYVSTFPREVGGKGTNYYHVGGSFTLADLKSAHSELVKAKAGSRIFLPPRGRGILTSKITPRLMIPEQNITIAVELGAVRVSIQHVAVLNWMLKREYYESYSGIGMTEAADAKFTYEIRAKKNLLLRSGEWVDEPSDARIELLQQSIENIDRGRRSDLNHSSIQDESVFLITDKFTPKVIKENKELLEPEIKHEKIHIKPEDVQVPASAKGFRSWAKDKGL